MSAGDVFQISVNAVQQVERGGQKLRRSPDDSTTTLLLIHAFMFPFGGDRQKKTAIQAVLREQPAI